MSPLWASFSAFAMKHPIVLAGTTTAARYVICDVLIQQSEIKNEGGHQEYDYRRTAALASFGMFYASGPAFLLYNKLLPRYLPTKPFAAAVIDVAVYCPIVFYPIYYGFKVSSQPAPKMNRHIVIA